MMIWLLQHATTEVVNEDIHSILGAISHVFLSQVEWCILILHKNVKQLEGA